MNDKTMPEDNAAFSMYTVDIQDSCSLGMDRALGIEKDSLDIAARDRKGSWFKPILGIFFGVAAQAIATCMNLQLHWRTLRVPRASAHVGTAASDSGNEAKPTAEVLESSMDIVIGPQHVAVPRSAAVSNSGRKAQPQPTPDELAFSMDIALGERFTVSSTVASTSESQRPIAEVPVSDCAPQWPSGRTASLNRLHPTQRIVERAAIPVKQEAKPLRP